MVAAAGEKNATTDKTAAPAVATVATQAAPTDAAVPRNAAAPAVLPPWRYSPPAPASLSRPPPPTTHMVRLPWSACLAGSPAIGGAFWAGPGTCVGLPAAGGMVSLSHGRIRRHLRKCSLLKSSWTSCVALWRRSELADFGGNGAKWRRHTKTGNTEPACGG